MSKKNTKMYEQENKKSKNNNKETIVRTTKKAMWVQNSMYTNEKIYDMYIKYVIYGFDKDVVIKAVELNEYNNDSINIIDFFKENNIDITKLEVNNNWYDSKEEYIQVDPDIKKELENKHYELFFKVIRNSLAHGRFNIECNQKTKNNFLILEAIPRSSIHISTNKNKEESNKTKKIKKIKISQEKLELENKKEEEMSIYNVKMRLRVNVNTMIELFDKIQGENNRKYLKYENEEVFKKVKERNTNYEYIFCNNNNNDEQFLNNTYFKIKTILKKVAIKSSTSSDCRNYAHLLTKEKIDNICKTLKNNNNIEIKKVDEINEFSNFDNLEEEITIINKENKVYFLKAIRNAIVHNRAKFIVKDKVKYLYMESISEKKKILKGKLLLKVETINNIIDEIDKTDQKEI